MVNRYKWLIAYKWLKIYSDGRIIYCAAINYTKQEH